MADVGDMKMAENENLLDRDPADFPGLTDEERANLAVVMTELRGWTTQDVDLVLTTMAEDAIYQDMTQPPAYGHVGIRQFGNNWVNGSPDFTVHVDEFVIRGSTIVNRGIISGHIDNEFWGKPGTGKKFDLPYCQVAHLKDGKIVRIWDFSDAATMAFQVGWTDRPFYE